MSKKLYRSKDDKKITGLCGGIAKYFGVDSGLIRTIVVLVTIFTAVLPALVIYFAVAFLIPEEGDDGGATSVNYQFVDNNNPNNPNNPNNNNNNNV